MIKKKILKNMTKIQKEKVKTKLEQFLKLDWNVDHEILSLIRENTKKSPEELAFWAYGMGLLGLQIDFVTDDMQIKNIDEAERLELKEKALDSWVKDHFAR